MRASLLPNGTDEKAMFALDLPMTLIYHDDNNNNYYFCQETPLRTISYNSSYDVFNTERSTPSSSVFTAPEIIIVAAMVMVAVSDGVW